MRPDILILGKNGLLGSALCAALGSRAIGLGRADCDLSVPHCFAALPSGLTLSAVINATAYAQVDQAESNRALAFRINADAVAELAAWCNARALPLIHFSTDYVFDGSGDAPHKESDATRPLNIYGESKLAGEHAITAQNGRYVILRTSWLYDAKSESFFARLRRLMRERSVVSVVNDQIGAPTYVPHLVQAVQKILAANTSPNGIYHLCNGGEVSRYAFAKRILELEKLPCTLEPIANHDSDAPAQRPLNSRLDCTKVRDAFGIAMPHWEEGLRECFAALQTI